MRILACAALLAVGFLGAWEASSRYALPRIPQFDDAPLTLAVAPHPKPPTVATPMGGLCPIASCTFLPSSEDPLAAPVRCDGFSCSTSAIYTYERGEWVTWAKQPSDRARISWSAGGLLAPTFSVVGPDGCVRPASENAVLVRCAICGLQGGPLAMSGHACGGR